MSVCMRVCVCVECMLSVPSSFHSSKDVYAADIPTEDRVLGLDKMPSLAHEAYRSYSSLQ